jgi:exportin-5
VTKSFLTYSVERIEKGSAPYQASCALWQDGFQLILPELLKFLRFIVQDCCDLNSVLTPA